MGRLAQIRNRADLGYFGIGLYNPKNSFNIGGVMRSLGAFDGRLLVVQGHRWEEKGDWRHMDTEGAHLRLPCHLGVDNLFKYVPYGMECVAVELSDKASNLIEFQHPKTAFYIFGPEDGAIPEEVLVKCKHKLYIPTEYSLNLYATSAVLCYDRIAKRSAIPQINSFVCPACGHVHWRVLEDSAVVHCNACGLDFAKDTLKEI